MQQTSLSDTGQTDTFKTLKWINALRMDMRAAFTPMGPDFADYDTGER